MPRVDPDDVLPEYDFSAGQRNRYAARFGGDVTLVRLDPDVAAAFPDAEAVIHALRALAGIIHEHAPVRRSQRSRARKRRIAPR